MLIIFWQVELKWWTQTNRVGGSAETEVMALIVMPARPSGPSVVKTETVHAA
ncbi:MAG: hypothetical protein OXF20_04495 [Gammaproteobacteria bacterium]|nr:hypothetical protein [Gammaproteobacteria bacterium]